MISALYYCYSDLGFEEFWVLSLAHCRVEPGTTTEKILWGDIRRRRRTYFKTSSAIISLNSAANSTPVGPPPQMTNDNNRFRSSGEVVGREASSKLANH